MTPPTKNHLCPECHVCSYCLQKGTYPCEHPIKPTYNHCQHHNDLTPEQCGTCIEKNYIVELENEIVEWKSATGLSYESGDPDNITPANLRDELKKRPVFLTSNPGEIAYIASNLAFALCTVEDTGDWYGTISQWCQENKGGVVANAEVGAKGMKSSTEVAEKHRNALVLIARYSHDWCMRHPGKECTEMLCKAARTAINALREGSRTCEHCGCLRGSYLGDLETHRGDCPNFPL